MEGSEEMEKELVGLLREGVRVKELLAGEGVHVKLKDNLGEFVQYCRINWMFTQELLELALKVQLDKNGNSVTKSIAYIANDLITADSQAIVYLFIMPQSKQEILHENNTVDQQLIYEQQSQILKDDKTNNRYRFLIKLLQYVTDMTNDQNCLNYMTKILSHLARRKPKQLLYFLKEYNEYQSYIIKLIWHPCVGQFLVILLSQDEQTIDQIQAKGRIMNKIIEENYELICNENAVSAYEFVEEMFQLTKYRQGEQRTFLMLLIDGLVSEQCMSKYCHYIRMGLEEIGKFKLEQKCGGQLRRGQCQGLLQERKVDEYGQMVYNSIHYLEMVARRMLIDEQCDPYNGIQTFPLTFQTELMLNEYPYWLAQLPIFSTLFLKTHSMNRILQVKTLQLLLSLCRHSQTKIHWKTNKVVKEDRLTILKTLFICFAQEITNGIISNLLLQIIQGVLSLQLMNCQPINRVELTTIMEIMKQRVQECIDKKKMMKKNCWQRLPFVYKLLVLVENYMKDVSGDNVEQNCWFGFKELECEKIVEMYVNETQKTVNTRVVPKEFKFMQVHIARRIKDKDKQKVSNRTEWVKLYQVDNCQQDVVVMKVEPCAQKPKGKKIMLDLSIIDDKIKAKKQQTLKNNQKKNKQNLELGQLGTNTQTNNISQTINPQSHNNSDPPPCVHIITDCTLIHPIVTQSYPHHPVLPQSSQYKYLMKHLLLY